MLSVALVLAGPAFAGSIQNTATVTYRGAGAGEVSLKSNTVVTEVLPLPTPATLRFLRYDPSAGDSAAIPVDGGQCRTSESGSFVPLPEPRGEDGKTLDSSGVDASEAVGYYVGEPVVVSISDANRNADPATREYVDVDIITTTGDAETLRLKETGPDTGVFAGAIQSVAIPPAATQYDCVLSLAAYAQLTARYTDTDFPLDALAVAAFGYSPLPQGRTVIRLEQSVSKDIVEIGDFLQYTLVVRNIHDAPAVNVRIRDVLPTGLRYRAGSLRVGLVSPPDDPGATPASMGAITAAVVKTTRSGIQAAGNRVDPVVSNDGATLQFPVGDLMPGGAITATFVAEVGAGASGQHLLNYAIATANGALSSNETDTVVRMRDSLNTSRFTIVGRVTAADSCEAGANGAGKGVANVRILLEDGTYATTDQNGAYHFEGVRPGTHVVQVDKVSLPQEMEPADCAQDTRRAGRAFSQFVEGQGGSLWRADFQMRPVAPASGVVGARLEMTSTGDGGTLHYVASFDGSAVPVSKLRAMLLLPAGASIADGSARIDGVAIATPAVADGVAIVDLGDPGVAWRRRLEFDVRAGPCPAEGYSARLAGLFEAGGHAGQRTPPAEVVLPCDPGGRSADSGRQEAAVTAAAAKAASPYAEQTRARASVVDDRTAAGGGDVDWLAGQAPGVDWLFPALDYNPRAPSTRVVIKHLPGQAVALRMNGEPVEPLHFDGLKVRPDRVVASSAWKAITLKPGDNLLEAEVTDASGATVAKLSRVVHFANSVARAEFVPEQSILVADGVTKPVVAVRMLDAAGRPLRASSGGALVVAPPYELAASAQTLQDRKVAGVDSTASGWHTEGDAGIAYIELQPTTNAGEVALSFPFGQEGQKQEIRAWLKTAPRDWVVVGFAKGSVGYETLEDNMRALPQGEEGKGLRGEGQVALYAKGRVLGKWLMTLSYDSKKPTDQLNGQSLLSTIDPGQYYTLYGDGTDQRYDAASARKLYLKLERDQFYALFGDFQSGLDKSELSRYQRALNGLKVEYHGPLVEFTGFAAKTSQSYMRDEIQGDGTSGLYRLKHKGLVINSERIRIETRDRYHSEQILDTRELARHIDYDIDYDNATLFFRSPIASRDADLNPIWIVAEYETAGTGEEFMNGGGRVGVNAMGGRLQAGATYVRDEDADSTSQLAGLDAKFRLTPRDQLRAEAAASRGEARNGDESSGNAWLLEWDHRSERFNLLGYARRQSGGFGLGQQGRYESGMFKTGVQGQYRLGARFSLEGEAYRQEDLQSEAVRDVARVQAAYGGKGWTAKAGLQWARDQAEDGRVAESRQVTAGATKSFFDRRLELGVQADFSLPGKNESVDFPTRLALNAAYKVNNSLRLLAAQEFTDGKDRDTSTTRVGFEAKPWKNATLTSTFNQSQISEYGARTFGLFGLDQKFVVNERWSLDAAVDSSQAFNQSGNMPLVVDPSQPIQAGGIRDGGALTENFVAVSGGANYRTELWTWNARVEARQSDSSDRYGFTTAFLRQVKDGVALSASAQAFSQLNADGSTGILANAQLSWAFRPLGSEWSMLDKLEFHYDGIQSGAGESILGQATIAARGDARSTRLVNNFALNYASDAWRSEDGGDGKGSVLDLYQRSQLSLYYGSKYVLDSYDGDDYAGYTDILGIEARYDLTSRIDVGLRASVLHSWSQNTYAWAFGPSVGFTPFTNAWVSVGYNIRGFNDRDFESSHYTAKGAYLVFRMKFDQHSLGLDRNGAAAPQH